MVVVLVGIENQTITERSWRRSWKEQIVLSCSPTALVEFSNHNISRGSSFVGGVAVVIVRVICVKVEKEDAENELALAIIACSSDLNTDHKFKREDRLRVLVCVFVRAMPIRFCHRRIHFLSVLFPYKFGFVWPD